MHMHMQSEKQHKQASMQSKQIQYTGGIAILKIQHAKLH